MKCVPLSALLRATMMANKVRTYIIQSQHFPCTTNLMGKVKGEFGFTEISNYQHN